MPSHAAHHALFRALLALFVTLPLLTLTGCVGWGSYPELKGETSFVDPDSRNTTEIMAEAVTWAAMRYPPYAPGQQAGSYAVSLPEPITRLGYMRTVQGIDHRAVPYSPDTAHLPTYIIQRVWVRPGTAKVDLFTPIPGKTPDQPGSTAFNNAYAGLTVTLKGSPVSAWRVTTHRTWVPGALPPPAPNAIPAGPATPAERQAQSADTDES